MRRGRAAAIVALSLLAAGLGLVGSGSPSSAATLWAPGTSSSTWYSLAPRSNTGLRLDVRGGRLANLTPVQQYTSNGTVAQQFGFRSLGNGYYRIVTKLSDSVPAQYLNVHAAGTTNGTKVETLVAATGYQQQWRIYDLGNGYRKLVPRHASGKCLDVTGASTSSGVQLQIYTCNGTAAQQFRVDRSTTRMWYSGSLCPNLVVFGVRGSNEKQYDGPISWFGTNVSLAARETVRRIVRTGSYRYKGITYPATLNSDLGAYLDSVYEGSRNLVREVDYVTSHCGTGTRYALLGYSQGSHVIREAVDSLSSTSRARVAAVGLIADPTRRGSNLSKREVGLIESFGTGPLNSGVILEFMRANHSCGNDCEDVAASYDRSLPTASSKVATVCQASDAVCNGSVGSYWFTGWNAGAQHNAYYQSRAGDIGWLFHLRLAQNGYK